MQNPRKRIDRMIEALEDWGRKIEEIQSLTISEQAKKSMGEDLAQKYEKSLEVADAKAGKELRKTFGVIRGYIAEIDVVVKQLRKGRLILNDANIGDVATGEAVPEKQGKTLDRVFQVKTISTAGTNDVNGHIAKAFEQIFGKNGEIPSVGAKLAVVITVFSKKNPWPFKSNDYKNKEIRQLPSARDLEAEVTKYLHTCIGDTYNDVLNSVDRGGKRRRGEDGKAIPNQHLEFLDNIAQSKIVFKATYGKSMVDANGDTIQRLSNCGVSYFTVEISVSRNGNARFGRFKIVERKEMPHQGKLEL